MGGLEETKPEKKVFGRNLSMLLEDQDQKIVIDWLTTLWFSVDDDVVT